MRTLVSSLSFLIVAGCMVEDERGGDSPGLSLTLALNRGVGPAGVPEPRFPSSDLDQPTQGPRSLVWHNPDGSPSPTEIVCMWTNEALSGVLGRRSATWGTETSSVATINVRALVLAQATAEPFGIAFAGGNGATVGRFIVPPPVPTYLDAYCEGGPTDRCEQQFAVYECPYDPPSGLAPRCMSATIFPSLELELTEFVPFDACGP